MKRRWLSAARRTPPRGGRGQMAALGFLGGLTVGIVAWSRGLETFSRDLFSASVVRRFVALGHLQGRPSVDTARLLRDYISWETHPLLRRRAEQLLRRMERYLD